MTHRVTSILTLITETFTDEAVLVTEQVIPMAQVVIDSAPQPTRAERAAQLIHQSQGRIFGAVVATRAGHDRAFNGKVTADSFNEHDEENGLVTIYEMNALHSGRGAYRSIALEGVRSLRIDGVTYDLDAEYGPLPRPDEGVQADLFDGQETDPVSLLLLL